MGHGSYRASDWAKLKQSRGISSTSSAGTIFRGNSLQDKYNPKYIDMRESCDSEDSPNSTPIILGFDVTGSMGFLAAEIAKNSLNKTVLELYDKQPVTNPHIMCAAITAPDLYGSLQVTQFEADIRLVEQLLDLKVGFGGNSYSYDSLVWYFAAKHTRIDSFEKRGKKGFLFVIGDEVCGADYKECLKPFDIKNVFNDADCNVMLPLETVYRMASEKYEIFHIVTEVEGWKQRRIECGKDNVLETWTKFMPGRVANIHSSNIGYLSEVITSIMQITNGMSKADAISQWPEEARPILAAALEGIEEPPKTAGIKELFDKFFGK